MAGRGARKCGSDPGRVVVEVKLLYIGLSYKIKPTGTYFKAMQPVMTIDLEWDELNQLTMPSSRLCTGEKGDCIPGRCSHPRARPPVRGLDPRAFSKARWKSRGSVRAG